MGDVTRVELHPRSDKHACPYCHAAIVEGELEWPCPKCATRHHQECALENKKCAILACGEVPVVAPPVATTFDAPASPERTLGWSSNPPPVPHPQLILWIIGIGVSVPGLILGGLVFFLGLRKIVWGELASGLAFLGLGLVLCVALLSLANQIRIEMRDHFLEYPDDDPRV